MSSSTGTPIRTPVSAGKKWTCPCSGVGLVDPVYTRAVPTTNGSPPPLPCSTAETRVEGGGGGVEEGEEEGEVDQWPMRRSSPTRGSRAGNRFSRGGGAAVLSTDSNVRLSVDMTGVVGGRGRKEERYFSRSN